MFHNIVHYPVNLKISCPKKGGIANEYAKKDKYLKISDRTNKS